MKTPCMLVAIGLYLFTASVAPAQDRVMIGITRNGGTVFQTLIHRGRSSLRTEMSADGPGSRTESHSRLDDGADAPAPTPRTPENHKQAPPRVEPSVAAAPEPTPAAEVQPAAATTPSQPSADGGHLICIQQADGSWRACGLTQDQGKALHAVQVLRQQKIQARVFQFLPLPAEAAQLLPIENATGLAVRVSGEVYAVAKDGRLMEILLPSNSASE